MYRDPELGRLSTELQQEKNKVAILEEEKKDLQALLSKEAESIKIPEKPVEMSGFRRLACWFGSHHYELWVESDVMIHKLQENSFATPKFNRVEFEKYCRVFCKHCRTIVFNYNKETITQSSVADMAKIYGIINRAYDEVVEANIIQT